MKLRELQGPESYYAMIAIHKLLYGLKMLPAYIKLSYEDFLDALDLMTPQEQESCIREAAAFVQLEREELNDVVRFATDPNGVPYGPENIKNLKPAEFHEIIVAVGLEVMKAHKIKLVTEKEKKNSKTSALTSDLSLSGTPH